MCDIYVKLKKCNSDVILLANLQFIQFCLNKVRSKSSFSPSESTTCYLQIREVLSTFSNTADLSVLPVAPIREVQDADLNNLHFSWSVSTSAKVTHSLSTSLLAVKYSSALEVYNTRVYRRFFCQEIFHYTLAAKCLF